MTSGEIGTVEAKKKRKPAEKKAAETMEAVRNFDEAQEGKGAVSPSGRLSIV
jgi:hypothetical protein